MTSLPQPFQGVSASADRAAPASQPSQQAVSGQAGIANAEEALRSLIRFLEADSGSSKAVLRAAEIAGAALPPEPDQPLESVVFWATDFGIYGKVSITLPVNNGGDDQFDADFEDTMAFVKAVVGRRKEARAKAMEARKGRDGEAVENKGRIDD